MSIAILSPDKSTLVSFYISSVYFIQKYTLDILMYLMEEKASLLIYQNWAVAWEVVNVATMN